MKLFYNILLSKLDWGYFMLDNKALRNINKQVFKDYLKKMEYTNVNGITRGYNGDSKDYTRIVDFLKKEIKDPKSKINTENLNNLLRNNFFYDLNNIHFIYNLDSILGQKGIVPFSDIEPILNEANIKFQTNLTDIRHTKNFDLLCTDIQTIVKDNIEYITNLQFLIYIEEIDTNRGTIKLHSCIDLDLENNFASFKFSQNLFENYIDKHSIVDTLATMIQNKKGVFSPFNIILSSHNQVGARRAIQRLFVDLSQQAENILMGKTPKGTQKKIYDFLEEMNVQKNDDYVNQIIAVIYQNISKSFSKTLFNDGWAFRFVFKEGDNTRASSSNDDFEPVYGKQVYWNLKELMFKKKGTDFIEAGLLWHIDESGNSVSVRLGQKNNLISVLYYKQEHNLIKRKEKESFVLRKIGEALQRK